MVLTRSKKNSGSADDIKLPSPTKGKPPRPKRTKQATTASKTTSKATSSKPKKGLEKIVEFEEHVERRDITPEANPKGKRKNGVNLNKEDCKLLSVIISQPMFDKDEASEIQNLFSDLQESLQSRVNTQGAQTRSASKNNSFAAVAETPLMKKFFSKCQKYRGQVMTRPSPIQEVRESFEASNVAGHSSIVGGDTKRKKRKKKVSYLLPPKSPMTKLRVTRSRAKKNQKVKQSDLNATSSTDASVKDHVVVGKVAKDSIGSAVTNDTGIFSQSNNDKYSTYQSTPMKSNPREEQQQPEPKKVVFNDILPATMPPPPPQTTTDIKDSLGNGTGKKRKKMDSDSNNMERKFEFISQQELPSTKRRLMTHEKENVDFNSVTGKLLNQEQVESIKKKKLVVMVERLPKAEIPNRTLKQQNIAAAPSLPAINETDDTQYGIIPPGSSNNNTTTTVSIAETTSTVITSEINSRISDATKRPLSTTKLSPALFTISNSTPPKSKDDVNQLNKLDINEGKRDSVTIITSSMKSKGKNKSSTDDIKVSSQQESKKVDERQEEKEQFSTASKKSNLNTVKNLFPAATAPDTPEPLPSSNRADETYVKPSKSNYGKQDAEFVLPPPPSSIFNTTHVIKKFSGTTTTTTTAVTTPKIQDQTYIFEKSPLAQDYNSGVSNQTYVVPNSAEAASDPNKTYVKKPVFDQTFEVPIPSKISSGKATNLIKSASASDVLSTKRPIIDSAAIKTSSETIITTTTVKNNTASVITDTVQLQERNKSSKNNIEQLTPQKRLTNLTSQGQKTTVEKSSDGTKTLEKGAKLSKTSTVSQSSTVTGPATPKFGKYPSSSSLASSSSSSSYTSTASSKATSKTDHNVPSRPSPGLGEKYKKQNSESASSVASSYSGQAFSKNVGTLGKVNTLDKQDACALKKKEIMEQKREAQRKKNEEWTLKVEKKRQALAEAEEKARKELEKQRALENKKIVPPVINKKEEVKIKYQMFPPPNPVKPLGQVKNFLSTQGGYSSCPDLIKKVGKPGNMRGFLKKMWACSPGNSSEVSFIMKPGINSDHSASTGTLAPKLQTTGATTNKGTAGGDCGSSAKNWKPISKTVPLPPENVPNKFQEPKRPKTPEIILPPPPPPPVSHPEEFGNESFYSVADTTCVSQYDMTLFHELDEDLKHRENKHIPNWAKDPEILHKSLFFQQPDLITCMTRRLFPNKNIGYQIFSKSHNMRK